MSEIQAGQEFAVGSEFAGYRIDGIAGRGGMGVVYRATQLRLDRVVALKVLASGYSADPDFRARFEHESQIAAQIEHPHVVPVYDVVEEDGTLAIAMRYIEGADLASVIEREAVIDPARAARIIDQVAEALDAAHARGLVHRDVKPANILLVGATGHEHAYLTDFGIARPAAAAGSRLTHAGQIMGTVDYASPEQLAAGTLDARSDVYSLGCVLVHCLTGEVPFLRDNTAATLYAHVHDDPPDLAVLAPDLPRGFATVVRRALAKDPIDRYQSAGDLGRAARAAAHRGPVTLAERSVATGAARPLARGGVRFARKTETPPSGIADVQTHCRLVAMALARGKVVPFLGPGANLCERAPNADWLNDGLLPSGPELAAHLAALYHYPEETESPELVRASQWVALKAGAVPLTYELHSIFSRPYAPNKLHRFLAELPKALRAKNCPAAGQLIITTNYDDALENAFAAAGEEVDLVYFATEPDQSGCFVHVRPDGERLTIPKRSAYRDFSLEKRSVILKVHGAVNREDETADSYVITEDDYIDYLARANAPRMVPAYLMARIRTSHLLFLGYGMRDWNLCVVLHHIWSEQMRGFDAWAIQRNPGEIDRRFWERKNIEILDVQLEDWVDAMREELR